MTNINFHFNFSLLHIIFFNHQSTHVMFCLQLIINTSSLYMEQHVIYNLSRECHLLISRNKVVCRASNICFRLKCSRRVGGCVTYLKSILFSFHHRLWLIPEELAWPVGWIPRDVTEPHLNTPPYIKKIHYSIFSDRFQYSTKLELQEFIP